MIPEATISHQTNRRLRIHIPNRKRDTAFFRKIRDELTRCEGVERVEANPSTASVLIHHRSTLESIAHFAEATQLFAIAVENAPLNPASMASRVNRNVGKLNKQVVSASKGTLDLTSIAALGLAIGGVIKGFIWKDFLPSGGNMVWWAVTLLARHDARLQGRKIASALPPAMQEAPRRRRLRRVRR